MQDAEEAHGVQGGIGGPGTRGHCGGGSTARGRNEEAGAAFRRAVEHSSSLPASFDRALAQASYGAFLRREGKRSAAVEQLETARAGFIRLGARPSLESCDRELASCGPLPCRRRPVEPGGLTPKEVSVAMLVTQGKTNREVASELAISVNTVELPPEAHLRQARHQVPEPAHREV